MGTRAVESSQQQECEHIFRSRYPPVQVPDNVTLPDFVLHNVELYTDKMAFVDATTGKGYTYGQVARDIRRFAKALRSLGLRKGRVVVVVLPNVPEYAIVALGIMAAGGVFSGANPAAHSSEIVKQVESADGKLIVSDLPTYHKVKDCGLPVIILGEEHVEGTIHWDELLEAAERAGSRTDHITNQEDEMVQQNDLCALPFSSGTTGLSKGVMLTHRNLVANLCSTLFSVSPEMAYGMTEHSCITLSHSDQHTAKRNSVGFILPNLEVKFVDPDTGRSLPKNKPGEICVKSQCVMKGYYKNEFETCLTIDKDGWLQTGDIGYIDDDGDIFLVDRIKELIKYKGFQVAPAELEGILLTHPSVEDAAVVGLPDEEAGEIPVAWVVLNSKAKESEEDIINYIASTVAQYKRVRVVQFVDSIPKSPSGKILRRLIKDKMLERLKNA
ncbi:4-coumarate--CoA ligase-like 1 isoform X2 [Nicotiana tabacum]|uniref:4-coumarate--CoA ligase-like 1 isoform X2 n=1 Tax=Nicotiana tabacum TaxID=4097 RepID=A0AC58UAN9_TOBAC